MKTTIISGAGTGIGAAAARRLADDGHAIILLGRNQANLDGVLATLSGSGHQTVSVDVSDKAALHAALNDGLMADRDLVNVFANAGIGGANEYGPEDRWEQIIDTNVNGSYYTAMECLPFLRASSEPYRQILFTGSVLARFGVPLYSAYCTSKAALTGLTRALAVELAQENVLVNALMPGWVDTEMARSGIQLMADQGDQSFEAAHREQMSFVPLQKMSDPDEVAALVSFLFGGQQSSITGQCLDINNGAFMI